MNWAFVSGLTLCDLGRAIALFYEDVAALGTECCGYGFGESVDAIEESLASFNTEFKLLQWQVRAIAQWREWLPCGQSASG